MSKLALAIRAARDNDRAFIRGNWAEAMRHASFSRFVENALYWPAQHELVDLLWGLGKAIVAHDPDDDDKLFGCLVWQPAAHAIVHWMYVRPELRRLGVCDSMLRHAYGKRPERILCMQAPNATFGDEDIVESLGLLYFPYALLGIKPAMEKLCPPKTAEPPQTVDAP